MSDLSARSRSRPRPPSRTVRRRHVPAARLLGITIVGLWALVAPLPPVDAQPAPVGAAIPTTGAPSPTRRVLLLYSEPRLTPSIVAVDTALRSTLEAPS